MSGLIKKVNLRDQVYEYIRDGILSQEFKRGENINLDDLSRKLGVSNTPIREGINLLVKEGLIEYRQNNGFYVISPDRETVNEILQVVFFMVVAAYRFCFRNGKMDQVIPKMEEQLKAQKEFLDQGDCLKYNETTYLYERCIVEGVGNKMLVAEYDGKQALLGFISTYYSDNNLEELKKVWAQHAEILDLMKQQKLEDAVLKMREHYYKKTQG
ncbi:GntR family transcriptional regulator [Treponema sp.]|uniref:GntR family transcriptional regulator n=1 Tax=Treponema sp. TaxID=166 RepID=UPI00298DEA92|nr:GntR family transcriptional regulator [Treponema sp.]MCR5612070.1 GntR family transcriptional regulator [Treponema sp.]